MSGKNPKLSVAVWGNIYVSTCVSVSLCHCSAGFVNTYLIDYRLRGRKNTFSSVVAEHFWALPNTVCGKLVGGPEEVCRKLPVSPELPTFSAPPHKCAAKPNKFFAKPQKVFRKFVHSRKQLIFCVFVVRKPFVAENVY